MLGTPLFWETLQFCVPVIFFNDSPSPHDKNEAVKKFLRVARWARGLAPMQFDTIFHSPPRFRAKSSVKTKSQAARP